MELIYFIDKNEDNSFSVIEGRINPPEDPYDYSVGRSIEVYCESRPGGNVKYFSAWDEDKTWFKTRAHAEKALEALESN